MFCSSRSMEIRRFHRSNRTDHGKWVGYHGKGKGNPLRSNRAVVYDPRYVRYGSLADIGARISDVGFTP